MNIKQFKKRWLHSYIEPELFYMPVGKKTLNNKGEPFIFEVEILKDNATVQMFNAYSVINVMQYIYTSANSNNQQFHPLAYLIEQLDGINETTVGYNLKAIDGEFDLSVFNDLPIDTENSFSKVFHRRDKCYMTVDYGDGNIVDYETNTPTIRTFVKNGITYVDEVPGAFKDYCQHTYSKAGTYYVKIYANIPYLKLYFDYYSLERSSYIIKGIVKWGDLGLVTLESFFFSSTYSSNNLWDDFYINPHFTGMQYVLTISNLCQGNPEIGNWNKLPDDLLNYFPMLVDMQDSFYQCNIEYIPQYFTKNNKFLVSVALAFQHNNNLKSIGDYAFANLEYLVSAHSTFIQNQPTKLTYIGNSLFENDSNLDTVCMLFRQSTIDSTVPCCVVGNKIFKNCPKLKNAYEVFYYMIGIEVVGDEIFAGCTALEEVSYMFYNNYRLKRIGKDCFKGCKHLYNFFDFFYQCYCLEEIPDNLFADATEPQYTITTNSFLTRHDAIFNTFCYQSSFYVDENGNEDSYYANIAQTYNINITDMMKPIKLGSNIWSTALLKIIAHLSPSSMFWKEKVTSSKQLSEHLIEGTIQDIWNYSENGEIVNMSNIIGVPSGYYLDRDTGERTWTYINHIANMSEIPRECFPWYNEVPTWEFM